MDPPRADRYRHPARCGWCGRALPPRAGPGRPRRYCTASCRQQAYVARRWAHAHGLGPDDLLVSRRELDELHSRLYCLQAALEDVERDLAAAGDPPDPHEVRAALGWLLENARPAAEVWIEPRAPEG